MTDWEFVIPMQREELLTAKERGQYVVEDVLSVSDIAPAVKVCFDGLAKDGPDFILERFGTLFSCLCNFDRLKPGTRSDIWNLILKTLASLVSDLNLLLDDNDVINEDTRGRTVNIVKMNSYILCELTVLFEESESKKPDDIVAATGKGRSTVKKKQTADMDWTHEKIKVIGLMRELWMLPLNKAWSPPVIEEEFLNLYCNCCYKMLGNGNINRTRDLKDSIFHLLGSVLKASKNTISIAVRIIQLLQQNEHLAVPLAQAMSVFVKKYDMQNVLNQIIREIGHLEAKDFAIDSMAIRSFSAFLVEIAQHLPASIITNIAVLLTHLDGEHYGMRNCILGIMGEILVQTCPTKILEDGEEPVEMDERKRLMRDQFLDNLEAHIHDVHAFVRSRALNIWSRLFEEKAVPLERVQVVLELVVGRLEDKGASVRKSAINLITAILRTNPFGASFSLTLLKEKYNNEMEKLKAKCLNNNSSDSDDTCVEVRNRSQHWSANKNAINTCLKKLIVGRKSINANTHPSSKLVIDIRCLIDAGKYEEAFSLFLSKGQAENNVHSGSETEEESASDESSHSLVSSDLLNSLRNIYLGDAEPRASPGSNEAVKSVSNGVDARLSNNLDASVQKQKRIIKYFKDSISFVMVLNRAMPLVCNLLHSEHTTDILMAIEFFVLAYEFGMLDAMIGIRKMLTLIWSKTPGVKESVVAAYRRLYIDAKGGVASRTEAIAKTLISLVKNAMSWERTSLEEMICEFVRAGIIPDRIYVLMWNLFGNRTGKAAEEDSNAAIVFLGMAARANVDLIRGNLTQLVSVGLGDRAKGNFRFSFDVCYALLKLEDPIKPSVESKKPPVRMPHDHIIFQKLSEIVVHGLNRLDDEMYIPFVERVVLAVYKLAEHPDLICEKMIVRILRDIINVAQNRGASDHQNLLSCPPVVLARFLALCGQVALCQMTHLDVSVFSELKRRRLILEDAEKKGKGKKRNASRKQSLSARAAATPRNKLESMDDDDGLLGATADDAETECIAKVCEKELVTDKNLLASIAPIIVTIASNPGQFQNPKLQAATCLALAKYMMVSSEFCNSKMQLLVTISEKSEQPTIRANTIVALGDLACRFPNIVDPWTPHLYARLSDNCFDVRRNALVVLTHLILHDMIKVKGQISDLALCVIDDDKHIADQAKLFFNELSQKANSIFNVLPDIITRLSDLSVGTTEEKFERVMKFILPFVQKDRLVESLVEKLLHRFPLTRSERQWRDLALCMPLLCRNTKCYSIILANISFIADKLHEETVYKHFMEVVSNAKKLVKPDSATIVDELEQKITDLHNRGVDNEAIATTANHVSKKHTRNKRSVACKGTAAKSRTSQRSQRLAQLIALSDDDDDDDLCQSSAALKTPKALPVKEVVASSTLRRNPVRKRIQFIFSSDSDGDDDMSRPARKSPHGANVNVSEESSDTDS